MRMVRTAEAAAALGCTPDSVRHYVARGRLTRYGTVRRAWFDLAEVWGLHDEIWGIKRHPATSSGA